MLLCRSVGAVAGLLSFAHQGLCLWLLWCGASLRCTVRSWRAWAEAGEIRARSHTRWMKAMLKARRETLKNENSAGLNAALGCSGAVT